MIINELYDGQGLGNQLWCYGVTRIIAYKNGYDFLITGRENYKGKDIIDLDFGLPLSSLPDKCGYIKEILTRNHMGTDVSGFDVELWNAPDNTKIDGTMQSMKYIEKHKNELSQWLKIKEDKEDYRYSDNDICIIHFRGGDYIGAGKTLLRIKYYNDAMNYFLDINPAMKFYVVTDDWNLATLFFKRDMFIGSSIGEIADPYRAGHHIGGPVCSDYSILNSAKNIILSNSTFGFWAAYTNTLVERVIAPKYWFAHNYTDGNWWSTKDMIVKEWTYIDREGNIENGEHLLL